MSDLVGDSLVDLIAGQRLQMRVWLVGEPDERQRIAEQAARDGISLSGSADGLLDLVSAGKLAPAPVGPMTTSEEKRRQRRIVVVGSGTRFLSGISVYTVRLANILAQRERVAMITMRRLLPARLYPGRERVGAPLTALAPEPGVKSFDGVDWFWLPSIFGAAWFIFRQRPQIAIFQWWTGTVLHSYIVLALLTKLVGGRVVIEFHEVLDTGELKIPLANAYVKAVAPILMHMADGFAVHSEFDRQLVAPPGQPRGGGRCRSCPTVRTTTTPTRARAAPARARRPKEHATSCSLG